MNETLVEMIPYFTNILHVMLSSHHLQLTSLLAWFSPREDSLFLWFHEEALRSQPSCCGYGVDTPPCIVVRRQGRPFHRDVRLHNAARWHTPRGSPCGATLRSIQSPRTPTGGEKKVRPSLHILRLKFEQVDSS